MMLKSRQIERRQWLQWASSAAMGAMVAGSHAAVSGIEPIGRDSSFFKFSLAAYSYRDMLQGDEPLMNLFEFVDECARFQLQGAELTSYYFPKVDLLAFLRRIKGYCFRQGIDISGTAVGNDFGLPVGPQRDEQLQMVRQWIDYAEMIDAPVIRIFAGHVPTGMEPAEAHKNMVEGIRECCAYAGDRGIYLALENHGGPTATADGLLSFVHAVNNPWFGVNLDTGNFASDDVYGDLERVAPYAINVQVKVMTQDAQGRKKPTDYVRLGQLLRKANYRGYVVLEFEEPGDVRQECRRHLDRIRQALV